VHVNAADFLFFLFFASSAVTSGGTLLAIATTRVVFIPCQARKEARDA
jgi:hypothetical protein